MKDIIITGAGGGMGSAAAKYFAARGFRVFALDIAKPRESEGVIFVKCDITDEKSVSDAFETVSKLSSGIFAVVHFAGIYMLDSLVEMDSAAFSKILDVNLRGAFLINKAFLPRLSRGSRIIITTSELAPLDPLPFTGVYAVTKAALDKYAFSLRMELQLLGISVSVLRAGAVKTDMLGISTDALERFCENTALYSCNARRFRAIVDRVEARCVEPEKIARLAFKIAGKKHPRFAWSVNRNPWLVLMHFLPKRMQLWAIRTVLK